MIMTQSGFPEICAFCIRRSMLLRNQADTDQMLTWNTVFVWEKRNLLSFPEMRLTRVAKLFAISLCFHTECPADKSHAICQDSVAFSDIM